MRFALGPLKVLLPDKSWLRACRRTHEFSDVYVERALEYRQRLSKSTADEAKKNEQRTLLYHMAQQTSILRDQIVQAMMAATETTASLISSVFHVLANDSDVLSTLRAELLAVGSAQPSFDELSRLKYL